ncbi:hypothetical protein B0H63DRAFT_483193 [Podospora didyma]|uniref:Uncharacterized protein n=1 Tax=Podospora didyma TaxID=330526 RepID=A0AAE0N6B5_9PEZI|nr:hypothetical protein B0H63DRAFT_483193 [Podospora didyma]
MDYIAIAVRIDNQLFERSMEKRTNPVRPYRANMGKRVPPRQGNTSWGAHREAMELDATQHQSTKKGPGTPNTKPIIRTIALMGRDERLTKEEEGEHEKALKHLAGVKDVEPLGEVCGSEKSIEMIWSL